MTSCSAESSEATGALPLRDQPPAVATAVSVEGDMTSAPVAPPANRSRPAVDALHSVAPATAELASTVET